MKIALLSALNAERAKRSAAVLVTDLDSGEQRLVKAGQLKKDPLAIALQEQLRLGKSGTVEDHGPALFPHRAVSARAHPGDGRGPYQPGARADGEAPRFRGGDRRSAHGLREPRALSRRSLSTRSGPTLISRSIRSIATPRSWR